MSKILLFGGSGFLGPTILEKYPEMISAGRTPPPSYLKNQHIQLDDLNHLQALDSQEFDKVIFLIGNSNHHALNLSPLSLAMDYNVTPLAKVLSYLSHRKIKKFVCFTAALLYDVKKLQVPVDESQPINPYINHYLFSKYTAEELTKLFADKVPIINIRISNIYGPTKLIRPDLVPTLIQNALSPHETTVWSTEPIRDFIYTYDAAEAIVKLLDTSHTGLLNLGTGTLNSVGAIVQVVEKLSKKKIKSLNKTTSGPMKFCFDISKVQSLTGWKPRHSLEEGITQTYERMKEWADECRWWEQTQQH